MSRARDVSRTIDDYARVALEQNGEITRDKKIQFEELLVYFDSEKQINFIRTIAQPIGDIISLVIETPKGDLPIDGKFNQSGQLVEFLRLENFQGCKAYIKYLRVT